MNRQLSSLVKYFIILIIFFILITIRLYFVLKKTNNMYQNAELFVENSIGTLDEKKQLDEFTYYVNKDWSCTEEDVYSGLGHAYIYSIPGTSIRVTVTEYKDILNYGKTSEDIVNLFFSTTNFRNLSRDIPTINGVIYCLSSGYSDKTEIKEYFTANNPHFYDIRFSEAEHIITPTENMVNEFMDKIELSTEMPE